MSQMVPANNTAPVLLQTMLYLATQMKHNNISNQLLNITSSTRETNNETICYGIYGCFPLGEPWTGKHRQINVYPQEPGEIKPRFLLYTHPANFSDRSQTANMNLHLNSSEDEFREKVAAINPQGKLFLISHGYLESGHVTWMREMAKVLLYREAQHQGAAVILIDWGHGSAPPYVQAVANIRLVGVMAAHLIHRIYEELNWNDLSRVHFIGHSLGSHLAGYAGHYLQTTFNLKLGRITGLDPAAPLFAETHRIVRLDRSDAHFVDVIHTDISLFGGLGLRQRIGHVDFYPNGGTDNPGCEGKLKEYLDNSESTLIANMQQFLGCNHIRSYQFLTESIRNMKCPFMAITCPSFQSFQDGECINCQATAGHLCLRMGYNSIDDYKELKFQKKIKPNRPPILYSMTAAHSPFCGYHYKITVYVSGHDESILHGGEIGSLSMQFHRNEEQPTNMESDRLQFTAKAMYFEPNVEYTNLVVSQRNLGQTTHASVYWEHETSLFNPLTWRILTSPRIYLSFIQIESLEMPDIAIKMCPIDDSAALVMGSANLMHSKYC